MSARVAESTKKARKGGEISRKYRKNENKREKIKEKIKEIIKEKEKKKLASGRATENREKKRRK